MKLRLILQRCYKSC